MTVRVLRLARRRVTKGLCSKSTTTRDAYQRVTRTLLDDKIVQEAHDHGRLRS